MTQVNVDPGILQEKNIADGVYARNYAGYCVVKSDAPSCHRGGVELFYKESLHLAVEDHQHHGPKISSFQMVTGR